MLPVAAVRATGGGSPVLTVAAHLLVAMAGGWLGVYALGIHRRDRATVDHGLWWNLTLGSVALVVFGLYEVANAVDPARARLVSAFGEVAFVLFLLYLAFGIRKLFHESAAPSPRRRYLSRRQVRWFERALLLTVAVEGTVLLLAGDTALVDLLLGIDGVVASGYGVVVGFDELSTPAVRGTTVGGLLGYLVPGLGCAGLVSALTVAGYLWNRPVLIAELQHVVVVVVAAFLLLAGVRLHDLTLSLG